MDKATSATAPAAAAVDTATWAIDANTLKCILQQETNLTGGDEVYVASIRFRTTPGVAGTTSAAFTGGLVDINSVNTGDTRPIPNSMGRVAFANVTRLGGADIAAGKAPEVIGTATIVMESDLTANAKVDKLFTEAAAEVQPILAEVSEGVSLAALLSGDDALATTLAQLALDIEAATKPTFLQKLGLFITSFGDADDPVDKKLNVFVAVDHVLAPLVDAAFADALPASVGVGGGLRARTYTQRFSGRGAKYDITFGVSK
jgi:hypothetical protein